MRIFTRLTPIILLICFVCFGITYIFGINNLTYLNTIHTTNGTTIYTFDFSNYVNNLDINILKRATQNAINLNTFKNIIEAWETIWQDGYDFGDLMNTIVNGFIMVIDMTILIVNIPLIIIRICAGIILTGLSLIGINISNETGVIIPALNSILDFAAIPYVEPAIF